MRKLASRRAGLREQLGYRGLEQILGEQKARLQWNPRSSALALIARGRLYLDVLVEEPLRFLLEH